MKNTLIETINQLFISVDNHDWEDVLQIFNNSVLLDYTSMVGGEPAKLPAEDIITSWKSLLPGFDKTHHQTGNFIIKEETALAHVFCYGTATHYLANETGYNTWTVVGSYDFELLYLNERWRISSMKFNFKYMDGNTKLPALAQERLRNNVFA